MIRFTCTCGRQLQVEEKQAGSSVACTVCSRTVTVPDAAASLRHGDPWYAPGDAAPVDREGGSAPTASSIDGENDYKTDREKGSTEALLTGVVVLGVILACSILLRIRDRALTRPWSDGLYAVACVGIVVLVAVGIRNLRRSDTHPRGSRVAATIVVAGLIGLLGYSALAPRSDDVVPPRSNTAFSNLTEIGLAFRKFQQQNGHFPAAAIRSQDGKQLLSWRVAILPYLEGSEGLYREFHLDEPWDSRHNMTLLTRMPVQYADGDPQQSNGQTRAQVYIGPGTAFESPRGHARPDFTGGPGKTVLVVEGQELVPWTKPVDLAFGPQVVFVRPHKRGLEKPYYLVLAADCTVHSVPVGTPGDTLRALITRNNREKVEWP
jgi:hypothetical protein